MSSTPAPKPQQPNPAEYALQAASGYLVSICMNVAVELGVPEKIGETPRPIAQLAKEVNANEDALYRMMRMLASVGIFTETSPRTFGHTPPSATLRADAPNSVRDMVHWWCDPFHFRAYAELIHSIRTGETCVERVTGGKPIFEYFPADPRESEVFNRAMVSFSAQVVPAVLAAYDFSGIETLVDVAGGHGSVLCPILAKYPKMRGILADLEHVIAGAGDCIRRHGVEGRVKTEACDFFRSVPAGGDTYLMKHIIHDWPDDKSLTILRNIATAMGSRKGKVLLIEAVLTAGNEPHLGKFVDIEMLALPGGRERTEAEFAALFEQAGFRLTRVVPTQAPLFVIEAVRV